MNKDKKIKKLATKIDNLHLINSTLLAGYFYKGENSELKNRVVKQLQAEALTALIEIDNILMNE